jgi:hypothetical protein
MPLKNSRPRLLFLSLANFSGCDRLPAAMIELGARCAVISPPGEYCTMVEGIEGIFLLPRNRGLWLSTLAAKATLSRAIRSFLPDFVIPLDDAAALLLRGIVARDLVSDPVRRILIRSLGAVENYPTCCGRRHLMSHAQSLSITVPAHGDAPPRPALSKGEHACGGGSVFHVPADGRQGPSRSWLRWIRSRIREAIWRAAGCPEPPPKRRMQQSYVVGCLAVCNLVALDGVVLERFAFLSKQVDPNPFGPSTVIEITDLPMLEHAATKLIESLSYSGFASLDFIIDECGEAHLIELNARCSTTSHLGRHYDRDLCSALLNGLRGKERSRPSPRARKDVTVALFPRELLRMPDLASIDARGIHDVPHSQPAVVAAYLKVIAARHGVPLATSLEDVIRAARDDGASRQTLGQPDRTGASFGDDPLAIAEMSD